MRDGGPHTENHLLCHDYRFHVTFRLEASLPLRGSVIKHIRLIKDIIRDKTMYMYLTDEYALNSNVHQTSGTVSILTNLKPKICLPHPKGSLFQAITSQLKCHDCEHSGLLINPSLTTTTNISTCTYIYIYIPSVNMYLYFS